MTADRRIRSLALAALVLVLGASVAAVGARQASSFRDQIPAEEDVLFLPRASALRALSLGHHELAADLVYLRAVIYFGTEAGGQRRYRWLENYLQTIVDLDPHWKTPYRWAGVATMYNGTEITRDKVELSSHFLRLGIEHFPSDWELPFMLACNLMFEMKPKDAAEKAKLTAEAATWMQRASLVGGAPSWAALLAATILRKEGRDEAALRHLEQVYYSTSDESTRAEVRNRLLSLRAKVDFDREARERSRFEEAWQADLPYLSESMYVLVGPLRSPNLDWRSMLR